MAFLPDLLLLPVGYLLGSIPFGWLAGRWLAGIDLRQEGSGSTGATNVLRVLGKGPALAVFLLDVLKGTAAVLLAKAVLQPLGDFSSASDWGWWQRAWRPWRATSGRCGWAGKAVRRWPPAWACCWA